MYDLGQFPGQTWTDLSRYLADRIPFATTPSQRTIIPTRIPARSPLRPYYQPVYAPARRRKVYYPSYRGLEGLGQVAPAVSSEEAQDCLEGGFTGRFKCLMVEDKEERKALCDAGKSFACVPGYFGMTPLWTWGIAAGGLLAIYWFWGRGKD